MKLFLAVDVPQHITSDIIQQTASIRKDYPYFNWVPSENFHVTQYYIGEVDPKKVNRIIERVDKTIFDIPLTHIFAFGTDLFINKNIVVYLSFHKNKELQEMNKRFKTLFEDTKKQKYMPHITLARWKIPSKQQYFHLKKKLQNLSINTDFPVEKLHLYESISKPKNPEYKKLHTFTLEE